MGPDLTEHWPVGWLSPLLDSALGQGALPRTAVYGGLLGKIISLNLQEQGIKLRGSWRSIPKPRPGKQSVAGLGCSKGTSFLCTTLTQLLTPACAPRRPRIPA